MTMQCPYVVRQYVSDKAFYSQEVDLTTAHTNFEIIVGDFNWLQFHCDGQPFGITVGIGTQDNKISLDKFDSVPVIAASKVWVTNDVRSGRTKLLLVFSRTTPLERYLGGQISLAELAARLGSIHTFDRRGEVIFADDFELGLVGYTLSGNGTGAFASISNSTRYSGTYSVKLHTGSSAQGDWARLFKALAYPPNKKMGIEIKANLPSSNGQYLRVTFDYYDGSKLYAFALRYDQQNFNLQYRSAIATYTDFQALQLFDADSTLFHVFKLVVDVDSKRYLKAIIDGTVYDMSAYVPYSVTNTTKPQINIYITGFTNAAAAVDYFIDDLVITMNEP